MKAAAKSCVLLLSIFVLSYPLFAQSADAVREKAEAIGKQMTVEEKVDYIGGTGFTIRPMPRLNLPAF